MVYSMRHLRVDGVYIRDSYYFGRRCYGEIYMEVKEIEGEVSGELSQ